MKYDTTVLFKNLKYYLFLGDLGVVQYVVEKCASLDKARHYDAATSPYLAWTKRLARDALNKTGIPTQQQLRHRTRERERRRRRGGCLIKSS